MKKHIYSNILQCANIFKICDNLLQSYGRVEK